MAATVAMPSATHGRFGPLFWQPFQAGTAAMAAPIAAPVQIGSPRLSMRWMCGHWKVEASAPGCHDQFVPIQQDQDPVDLIGGDRDANAIVAVQLSVQLSEGGLAGQAGPGDQDRHPCQRQYSQEYHPRPC